eukprot:Pgem_evm1s6276
MLKHRAPLLQQIAILSRTAVGVRAIGNDARSKQIGPKVLQWGINCLYTPKAYCTTSTSEKKNVLKNSKRKAKSTDTKSE